MPNHTFSIAKASMDEKPDQEQARSHPTLSETETLVMPYILKGMTNKQIAYTLKCATRTVEFHITHILKKMGVRSRIELKHCTGSDFDIEDASVHSL